MSITLSSWRLVLAALLLLALVVTAYLLLTHAVLPTTVGHPIAAYWHW